MRFRRHRSLPEPDNGALDEVLLAEQAAAAALAEARREADTWLASESHAIQHAKEATLSEIAATAIDDEHAARMTAAAEAAESIANADALADRLQALTDRELLPIVTRHLAAIGGELPP
jgi:hypothetical protein